MPKQDGARIAILGAGPIGLEAALYARRLNLPATVYERGRVGEHLLRWGHVRLFSPFAMNTTPLGRAAILAENPQHSFPADSECISGREHHAAYFAPLARTSVLKDVLRTETHVIAVGRRGHRKTDSGDLRAKQPFRLLVRDAKKLERCDEADVVLDCTGVYGQHRWLGDGGIPAVGEGAAETQIVYNLDDILGERKSFYAGKSVLLVGGGFSAATSVCNLAQLADEQQATWVTWLARCTSTQPLRRIANDPLRERDRLAVRANTLATRGDGNVEFHNQSVVESIESLGPDRGFKVSVRCGGKQRVWEVDRIVANIGYQPDSRLYRELQVTEQPASQSPAANSPGPSGTRTSEPGFFVLGAKSYGRNSHFLLRDGFVQVREVFARVTGKAELDLYRR
jgi:thioredoxin reductase